MLKECLELLNTERNKNPKLIGGIGEKNFGAQYRQGNRVYDSNGVAMAITAEPLGNTGGYSYLYLVRKNAEHKQGTKGNT